MTTKNKPRPTGKTVSNAEFRRMWMDETITATEIGRRLGITVQAVRIRARVRNLPPRKGGAGKVKKIDPVLFRKLWDANVSPVEIGRLFNCCPQNVTKRAREWGFPQRDCHKWNVVSLAAFILSVSARETQAALKMAKMVDGFRDARSITGKRAA